MGLLLSFFVSIYSYADMGMFDYESAPTAIQKYESSFLRAVVPSGRKDLIEIDISNMSDSELKDIARKNSEKSWNPPLINRLIYKQLENCKKYFVKDDQPICGYFRQFIVTTIFKVSDHEWIGTTHGFLDYFSQIHFNKSIESFEAKDFPVAFFDGHKNEVKKTFAQMHRRRYSLGQIPDYVEITFTDSDEIRPPIPICDNTPLLNEQTYLVGIPAYNTTDRTKYCPNDTDCQNEAQEDILAWSNGAFLDPNVELTQYNERDHLMNSFDTKDLTKNMYYFTNNDGVHGMSGGALFSTAGCAYGSYYEGAYSKTQDQSYAKSQPLKVLRSLERITSFRK